MAQSYVIRALLDSKDKENIYRDIQIDSNATCEALSKAILSAFNFSGDEAASFLRVDKNWEPLVNEDYEAGSLNDLPTLEIKEAMYVDDEDETHMGNTKISSIFKAIDDNLLYTYDLLKNWRFLLVLVMISEEKTSKAKVVLSQGIAPKEDSKEIDFDFDNLAKNERGNQFDDEEDDDEFADGWMDEYETDDY